MGYFWDEITRDKFILLYFFATCNLDLTNNQITTAVLQNEWSDYFSLQQSLAFLCDNGLLMIVENEMGSCYCISESGKQSVNEFSNRLPQSIKQDIDLFIANNKEKFMLQAQNFANFEKISDKEYIVNCSIIEGQTKLLELKLNVPSRNIAAGLAQKWTSNAQSAYSEILKLLT